MKRFLALLVVFASLTLGWYISSPWVAMKGLRDAAVAGDRAALVERVDFAALRANLREDLRGAVERKAARSDSPLAQIGGGLATGIGGIAVDAAVSPEGIAALVLTGRLAGPLIRDEARQEIDWSVERGGLNSFAAQGRYPDGRAGPRLHFERDGLSWRLVDVSLPGARS